MNFIPVSLPGSYHKFHRHKTISTSSETFSQPILNSTRAICFQFQVSGENKLSHRVQFGHPQTKARAQAPRKLASTEKRTASKVQHNEQCREILLHNL